MTDLTGKTALVTGSARGIGKAIALRFAKLGANIVINYSSDTANGEQALKEVREHGGQAIAVQADISEAADVDRLFAEAVQRFGSVDIVVANAGLELLGVPITDLTDEQIDSMVDVNARGALLTMHRAAKNLADNGRIVYIASTALANPVPGAGLYTATKAPGRYFAEVLARETSDRGITVNIIQPGPIDDAGVFIDSIPATPHSAASRPPAASETVSALPGMSPTPPNTLSATSPPGSAAPPSASPADCPSNDGHS
ncbi:SDR family NAD(P)-dependent oxidoreductase [Streptomyces nodosus]